MPYETLIVERRGPVGWLIFNRPDAMNSHNLQMLREVPEAWAQLAADDDVRVIVNTGTGRSFSTGADVKEIAEAGGMGERMKKLDDGSGTERRGGLGPRASNVWKPVIAAVNGVCAGGGLHFVCDADIVLAASNATFVDTHVSVGQVAALEPIGLIGRMPLGAILRMAMVGRWERLGAERAYELGMVDEVIDPPERLEEAAQALAETIARNSPSALMTTKRAIWAAMETGRTAALAEGMEYVKSFWGHPDNAEGPRAFSEKREPDWAPPTQTF
jgi:enoyl-CoA hydratase/carnithine racemase